jgi:hypothetical protein
MTPEHIVESGMKRYTGCASETDGLYFDGAAERRCQKELYRELTD